MPASISIDPSTLEDLRDELSAATPHRTYRSSKARTLSSREHGPVPSPGKTRNNPANLCSRSQGNRQDGSCLSLSELCPAQAEDAVPQRLHFAGVPLPHAYGR